MHICLFLTERQKQGEIKGGGGEREEGANLWICGGQKREEERRDVFSWLLGKRGVQHSQTAKWGWKKERREEIS